MRYAALLLTGGLLLAQEAAVRGPSMGMVFDPAAGGLRPVLGIPGAAVLGDAWNPGIEMESADIAPNGEYAIAADAGGRLFVLEPDRTPVALDGADGRVRFSPSGSAAVAIGAGRVTVIRGLPRSPSVAWSVDLPATEAAVCDDGSVVVYSSGGSTQAAAETGEVRPLPGVEVMAFLPGGHDAILASIPQKTIYAVRDAAGDAETSVIATEADGVNKPSAIASWNGRLVAPNGDGEVLLLNSSGGGVSKLTCDCAGDVAAPLNRAGVIRLTAEGQPLRILDPAAERILFVPALGGEGK